MRTPDDSYRLCSPAVPNLFAWVECNSKPLRIHKIEQVGIKTVAWIEGKAGEGFSVAYVDQRDKVKSAYRTELWVDGETAEELLTSRSDRCFDQPADHPDRFAVAEGARLTPVIRYSNVAALCPRPDASSSATQTSICPFRFAPAAASLTATTGTSSVTRATTKGTIQLRYWRVKLTKQGVASSKSKHEDIDKLPLMVLEFRYRDAAYLRQAGYLTAPVLTTKPMKKTRKRSAPSDAEDPRPPSRRPGLRNSTTIASAVSPINSSEQPAPSLSSSPNASRIASKVLVSPKPLTKHATPAVSTAQKSASPAPDKQFPDSAASAAVFTHALPPLSTPSVAPVSLGPMPRQSPPCLPASTGRQSTASPSVSPNRAASSTTPMASRPPVKHAPACPTSLLQADVKQYVRYADEERINRRIRDIEHEIANEMLKAQVDKKKKPVGEVQSKGKGKKRVKQEG